MPKNAATRRRYSGINVLILWSAVIEHGFAGQSWLTFRQALSLGGNVRKGEKGTTVVYADRFGPDEERRRAEREGDEAEAIPFLKRFTVFNTDQCEKLPEDLATAPPPVPVGLILPQAEALIAATGADFRIGGERAFYSPAQDFIQVPRPESYFEPINWHRTALHELGHWVGHPSRLARSLRHVRIEALRTGRTLRRDVERFRLRLARHRADRAACRLPRRLARYPEGG
jgi:antirestriction protein ArdC